MIIMTVPTAVTLLAPRMRLRLLPLHRTRFVAKLSRIKQGQCKKWSPLALPTIYQPNSVMTRLLPCQRPVFHMPLFVLSVLVVKHTVPCLQSKAARSRSGLERCFTRIQCQVHIAGLLLLLFDRLESGSINVVHVYR